MHDPTLPWEDAPLERDPPRLRRPMRRSTRAKLIGAPWQGSTPQSAQASLDGARAVMRGAAFSQSMRYLRLLHARGDEGSTDLEAADELEIQRSSINARRHELMQHGAVIGVELYPDGFRRGPTGIRNCVWKLRRLTCPKDNRDVPSNSPRA